MNETIKPESKNPVPVNVKFPAKVLIIFPLTLVNSGVTVETLIKAEEVVSYTFKTSFVVSYHKSPCC